MRDIQDYPQEICAIEVSPDFISNVTDKNVDEVILEKQSVRLDLLYFISRWYYRKYEEK